MEAYTKVMSEATDRELKLQMAEVSDYPFEELATAIRQMCNGSTTIKSLVNKQIEDTRTLESLEKRKRRLWKATDIYINDNRYKYLK